MTTKKPTPEERKKITADLRQKHQPIFDALGKPDALFIPKMAHYQKGLTGLHMGFFESELEKGQDIYTEKVSMELESEDPTRTLYKVRPNPHFKEEYAASEPMPNGHCRYFIPTDELIEVEMPKSPAKEADDITIPNGHKSPCAILSVLVEATGEGFVAGDKTIAELRELSNANAKLWTDANRDVGNNLALIDKLEKRIIELEKKPIPPTDHVHPSWMSRWFTKR